MIHVSTRLLCEAPVKSLFVFEFIMLPLLLVYCVRAHHVSDLLFALVLFSAQALTFPHKLSYSFWFRHSVIIVNAVRCAVCSAARRPPSPPTRRASPRSNEEQRARHGVRDVHRLGEDDGVAGQSSRRHLRSLQHG